MEDSREREKHAGGRPPMFNSVEELDLKIEEYFTNCPDTRKMWTGEKTETIPVMTITGLAKHLGFTSRQSFYDYENDCKFSYSIKRARLSIEIIYEQNLQLGIGVTGAIFSLKNFGWRDKVETEITERTVTIIEPEFK